MLYICHMAIWTIVGGVIALIICLVFLIQGAPYVKTSDADAEEILKIVRRIKPKRVLDIGSGNGKLVILLAQNGFMADGVELNPLLVWRSRQSIKKLGLSEKATIHRGNFWKFNTSKYDLVAMYAIQHIMPKLEIKLQNELPKGAHIVSNYFEFPNLKPQKVTGRIRIYKIRG